MAVTIIDRLIKAAVRATGDFVLCDGLIAITERKNTGIAFSLFKDSPAATGVVSAVIIALIVFYALKAKRSPMLEQIALWLMIGGGTGNLCDRLYYGFVTDYIETLFISFAVFNFADICVCVGAVLFFISALIHKG